MQYSQRFQVAFRRSVLAMVLFACGCVVSVNADNIVDLGTAPAGYTFGADNFGIYCGGLNNAGQAFLNVNKTNSDGLELSGATFLYSGGKMTNIAGLGGPVTFATGINDNGEL